MQFKSAPLHIQHNTKHHNHPNLLSLLKPTTLGADRLNIHLTVISPTWLQSYNKQSSCEHKHANSATDN
jgi:hypothetical protein